MVSMNLQQAKSALPALVDAALNGEEVVIAEDGEPMVRLVPCQERKTPRQPGRLRGQIRISDDFDAVDAEIIEMFENGGTITQSAPPQASPDDTLLALKLSDAAAAEIRLAAAVKLHELGRLSSGAAARLAGLPRVLFLSKLADYGVDTFCLSEDELRRQTHLA